MCVDGKESSPARVDSKQNPRTVSPIRQRMMEVQGHVEQANAAVQKAIQGYTVDQVKERIRDRSPVRDQKSEHGSRKPTPTRTALTDIVSNDLSTNDDLVDTLASWTLSDGVTVRRKQQHRSEFEDAMNMYQADAVEEDASLKAYTTLDHKTTDTIDDMAGTTYDNDDFEAVGDEDSKPVRGKYMGNDVEVVGLQCMLAKALLGDNDSEED